MKKIMSYAVLAAFIGGAAAIGGYKLLEHKTENASLEEKQKVYFANNPLKISSAGAEDFVQAAAAVSPAVVHIKTTYGTSNRQSRSSSPFDMFDDFFGGGGGRRMQRAPRAASGSGVILSEDGYIVTNNHVVDNAEKIDVILTDKRRMTAKVVGKDPNTDLALLKIEAKGLPVVKMGNSDNVQVGEWVLAVGYPLDLQTTVTAGIVSAKARQIGILAQDQQQPLTEEEYEEYMRSGKVPERAANQSIESFIQTDAAINPGNSGGALVNANGELVGINSAIASQSGRNEGYGFAIPVNLAKKILDDFMRFGTVKRGYVGVSFRALDAEAAEQLNIKDLNGLYVNEVVPNGGAAAAGIQKGDIIKKVDGKIVSDAPDLQEKIGRMNPGDRVKLTVLRSGQLRDFNVTLKGESVNKLASNANSGSKAAVSAGASFAPASAEQKARYNVKNGVVVTSVQEGKAFDMYGIPQGLLITSVNGIPVNSAADVEKALPQTRNNMVNITGVSANGTISYNYQAK
ncbi:trypsin-like peptidase domain-containing protein [Pedobacter sp. SYP-B3415]|uniref:trypsin-like peptidase domain-containing protein n=1 Tax=Pedobacter sp. SYP-B3415 TaxID=2496641 RepID=UPI00197DFD1D|nr:trypsin-like peptidase domain-containing protein [Pedobacter sp. SYP-B3415]